MKKYLGVAAILSIFILSSCGMGWNQTVKNFQSDVGGGLNRQIIVENTRTNTVLYTFEGKAYIDSNSKPGDVTIIVDEGDGTTRKADFIGRDYGVRTIEK